VAEARNEEQYKHAINDLDGCQSWQQHVELHSWFENKWLAERKVQKGYVHTLINEYIYAFNVQLT